MNLILSLTVQILSQLTGQNHNSLSILKLEENPMADQNLKPELFELNNGTMRVLITNLGCTITSLSVPGKDGIFTYMLCQLPSFYFLFSNMFVGMLLIFGFFGFWREIGWRCSWIRLCWTIFGKILWTPFHFQSGYGETASGWIDFCMDWNCLFINLLIMEKAKEFIW